MLREDEWVQWRNDGDVVPPPAQIVDLGFSDAQAAAAAVAAKW